MTRSWHPWNRIRHFGQNCSRRCSPGSHQVVNSTNECRYHQVRDHTYSGPALYRYRSDTIPCRFHTWLLVSHQSKDDTHLKLSRSGLRGSVHGWRDPESSMSVYYVKDRSRGRGGGIDLEQVWCEPEIPIFVWCTKWHDPDTCESWIQISSLFSK